MKSNSKPYPTLVLRGNKPVTKPMCAHTASLHLSPSVATAGSEKLELQKVGWRDVDWTLQLLLLAPCSNYAPGPTSSLMSRKMSTHPPRGTTVIATMTYTAFAIGSMLRSVSAFYFGAYVAEWRGLRHSCRSYLYFPIYVPNKWGSFLVCVVGVF